jgi:hypothetical protein
MFRVISYSHFTKLNDVLAITEPDNRAAVDSLRHLKPRKNGSFSWLSLHGEKQPYADKNRDNSPLACR